jgi:hypothetical protein
MRVSRPRASPYSHASAHPLCGGGAAVAASVAWAAAWAIRSPRRRGRASSRTRGPFLRAITRNPSCLISCSHRPPEGSFSVFVGRHGAMNPAGRVRCNMRRQIELGRDNGNSAEPGDKCGVDQLAMAGRPAGRGKPRPRRASHRRVGALTRSDLA